MSLFGVPSSEAVAESGVWQYVETVVLSGAAAVSFAGLTPASFWRTSAFVQNNATVMTVGLRFNNDSGGNYINQRLTGLAASVSAQRAGSTSTLFTQGATLKASSSLEATAVISKTAPGVRATVALLNGWDPSGDTDPGLEFQGSQWNNTLAELSRIDVVPSSGSLTTGTAVRLDRKDAS